VATLAIAEIGMRVAGFHPGRLNDGYLQFGYITGIPTFDEDGVLRENQPARVRLFGWDPELLWAPLPNTPFTNREGFRGREEFAQQKPADVLRLLFLGDSCTFLGDPVYPEIVKRLLAEAFPGRTIECINASVPGYSSVQGELRWARLARWQPDAVVVYFGWNDHWRGRGGLTDRDQLALGRGPRLLGLWRAVRGRWRRAPMSRVPLDDFEATLASLRDRITSTNAVAVFVTAPTGLRAGAMPPWAYRFFGDFYRMDRAAVDAIPAVHAAYAEAVRRVAGGGGAVLVDAEQEFRDGDAETLFRADQIHLRTPGHAQLAASAAAAITRRLGGS
jgi:lysophospholipase L1-like esterase